MKKILVIGGSQFVGRNLVEALLETNKYDITLFNRGLTAPHLFPNVKRIIGDRKIKADVEQLATTYWDCILDISGYWPNALEQQLAVQKGNFGRYVYISTCSHYQLDTENPHPLKEEEPIVACSEAIKNSEEKGYYNQHKAECERVLQAQKDCDLIILRPGLIIGKYDHTDRLYYWFHKLKHQENILVANQGKHLLSYTDVNDLARAIIQSIEIKNNFQVYNTTSFVASIASFIKIAGEKLGKQHTLISASTSFLEDNDVNQWVGLPLWLDGNYLVTDNSRLKEDYQFHCTNQATTIDKLLAFYSQEKNWAKPEIRATSLSSKKEEQLISQLMSTET